MGYTSNYAKKMLKGGTEPKVKKGSKGTHARLVDLDDQKKEALKQRIKKLPNNPNNPNY